jgi:hypothetical protein
MNVANKRGTGLAEEPENPNDFVVTQTTRDNRVVANIPGAPAEAQEIVAAQKKSGKNRR